MIDDRDLLSRYQVMIILGAPSVDTDRSEVLIEELKVDDFGIFALNKVFATTVLHNENERPIFVLGKAMSVVLQDV